MDKTLLLRAFCSAPGAVVRLNGLVLGELQAGAEAMWPMHGHVVQGDNRIQIECPHHTTSKRAVRTHAWVELHKDRGAGVLVQPRVLFDLESNHPAGSRLHKGRYLDHTVTLPVQLPRWRFFDLLGGVAQDMPHAALQDFVWRLVQLFSAGKAAALSPLFHTRNQELALAYGQDFQQFHGRFLNNLQVLMDTHTLAPQCLDPDLWRFRPVRGGALFYCSNAQGQALIQWVIAGDSETCCAQLPLHLAVINRDVLIVR
ncbi:MAG TPA: hypothetical protein VFV43_05145 [Limnobacter sp.]|nr:hypothetical protein [Limnobacter sp.]